MGLLVGGMVQLGYVSALSANPVAVTEPSGIAEDVAALRQQIGLADHVRGGEIRHFWSRDGAYLYYSEKNAAPEDIWRVDLKTYDRMSVFAGADAPHGSARTSLYAGTLEPETAKLYLERDGALHSLDVRTGQFDALSEAQAEKYRARRPKVYGSRFPQAPDGVLRESPSPDGSAFVSIGETELMLRAESGAAHALSRDTLGGHVWNPYSFRWSSGGRFLAAVLDDFSQSQRIALVAHRQDGDHIDHAYYPPVGSRFPQGRVHILDVKAGKPLSVLETGGDDHYLRLHRFSADEKTLYYFTLSRTGNVLEYWEADVESGRRTRVFAERSELPFAYPYAFSLAPNGAPIFPLANETGFLWLSERSGARELYLYRPDGKPARQLTNGLGRIHSIIGYDEAGKIAYVLVQSDRGRPYDTHLFAIDVAGVGARKLTTGPGRRSVQIDPRYTHVLETVSTPQTPTRTYLWSLKSEVRSELSRAEFDEDGLWRAPEEFSALAADGRTKLHGLLYKPDGFDPSKRYPMLEYIYAGPQAVWTPKTFLIGGHYPRALAKAGFLVMVVDGRGTPERGPAFQGHTYGRLGQVEIADHVAVIDALVRERRYIDPGRIGVFGTSFGGYYSMRAMLDAPGTYRAGVSSAPAMLSRAHIFAPVEAFMRLPRDNPEGYRLTSLDPLADRLAGPLLIMTGTWDVNTPFAHALAFSEMFTAARKPVRMIVMPERNHHFMRRGETVRDIAWTLAIRDFFREAFHIQSGGMHETP
ncbi:S9 family peptidase [Eilatimonas milleporae]|uniref:Dipeptidyl aminopeptidase/acylaminoacyl peptidase n=1 Tax=Eilatimonas milleporae TaxID=911205 RepID=A0A3M0C5F3_9PROT|nr:prolyl oligopeptidase family serine peptidase [Eilatimonas milleporae]RMB04958.1 dipeptidyl aminopeptidase/acylaminoacyl peptidase [Eilatimonas milleporae]